MNRRRRQHYRQIESSVAGDQARRAPNSRRSGASPTNAARRCPLVPSHPGFSLLEVILALAILAGAIAALGEVMRLGDQNASLARDESEAEMLASSVISELVAGSRQVQAISTTNFDMSSEPAWTYSVTVDATDYDALVAVRVSVAQQLAPELHPAHCDLVRWLPNPDYVPPNADQQSTTNSSSSSSSSSNNSSSSGSSSSGSR